MKSRSALGGFAAALLLGCVVIVALVVAAGNWLGSSSEEGSRNNTARFTPSFRMPTTAVTPVVSTGDLGTALLAPAGIAAADAVAVVNRTSPAVVTVINEQEAGLFAQGDAVEAGRGTGFFIDQAGHIVTNWHVVSDGDDFTVLLADGSERRATLVGSDPVSDLAIVRIEGSVPATVPFGDSDALLPGQPVLAIGSPLGTFTNTVTRGIVSALGRSVSAEGRDTSSYANLIQHDAAINPGNSGGPLLNLNGEVIGVNTLGVPTTQDGIPVQGIFFAVPVNTVRTIAAEILASGDVVYPYLGIEYLTITEELAVRYDLPVSDGLAVLDVVPGEPADRADIRPNDLILAIDNVSLDDSVSLTERLFDFEPGDEITLTILRGSGQDEVTLVLSERPAGP